MSVQHVRGAGTVCKTTMQHLRSPFTVCEMSVQHLRGAGTVCEMTMQHLHSPFTVCGGTMQHLRGPFTVCETTMQHLRGLFTVCDFGSHAWGECLASLSQRLCWQISRSFFCPFLIADHKRADQSRVEFVTGTDGIVENGIHSARFQIS